MNRHMHLYLDEEDYNAIQREIARRQCSRWPDGGVILPEGESNMVGAILAEACRDLDEYRAMFKE